MSNSLQNIESNPSPSKKQTNTTFLGSLYLAIIEKRGRSCILPHNSSCQFNPKITRKDLLIINKRPNPNYPSQTMQDVTNAQPEPSWLQQSFLNLIRQKGLDSITKYADWPQYVPFLLPEEKEYLNSIGILTENYEVKKPNSSLR